MARPRPIAALCIALVATAAQAQVQVQTPLLRNDAAEVEQMLRGGRADEALSRLDRLLADKPGDPQLRFLRGVALTEARRGDEAADVFVKLTEDYPTLAEPYNNLAVLYAGRGLYDQAREALETAVRNDPGYATAHENLGDVYARLAAASYAKARQFDPGNRSAAPKLALLRQALAPAAGASAAQR